jgi:hypothetical protein
LFWLRWTGFTKHSNNLCRTLVLSAQDWVNTTRVTPASLFPFFTPEQVGGIVELFPTEPKLMDLAQIRIDNQMEVPGKTAVKASIDDAVYKKIAEHQVMLMAAVSKLRWPAGDNQEDLPSVYHSLMKSPEVWARVMALILLTHSGTQPDTIKSRLRTLANGGKWRKLPFEFFFPHSRLLLAVGDIFGPNGEGFARANLMQAISMLHGKHNVKAAYHDDDRFHAQCKRE